MKVSVVVPCYNEEENIQTLVEAIRQVDTHGLDVEFILVDNGSKDKTGELIDQHVDGFIKKAVVENNIGFGFGIQTGIKAATGDYIGWIHGDVQVHPTELNQFFKHIKENPAGGYFLKAHRTCRPKFDLLFTWGQGIVDSALLHTKLRDISAFPCLYPKSVVQGTITDEMPNDFSIDLFAYWTAKQMGYTEIRYDVVVGERKGGKSSWNSGLKSRIKQSKRIWDASLKIKRGEKVL